VVVDDLDVMWVALLPDEANSPLVIDPDGMLPLAAASQCLEPVSRRDGKIVDPPRVVNQSELPQCDRLYIGRQPAAPDAIPNRSSLRIAEAHDHE
jgi:hypothetical protein